MKRIFTLLALLISLAVVSQPAGWTYNQAINITNPNGISVVDYQMKLTINTQSLIAAGRMNANGSDLRFAGTCTSSAFFNYWIEGGINTATTAIWVKIPFMAANSGTVIFMFFGNSAAIAASTIPGTFRGPNSATDSVSGGTSGGLLVCQRGFRFSPNQNLLVTDFGKNEPSGTQRYVTLFNYSTQAILSQTQVSGPSSTYSYGPISSPLWLAQGTQYVLQIFGQSTDGYFYQSSSQIGQHLTYVDMQYSNGGTQNTFPNSTLANYHYGYGDFLYYVCTTLAITPTFTIAPNTITISSPTAALCTGATVTLTTNAIGTFSWNTGSTANSIIVTPPSSASYTVFQISTPGCFNLAVANVTINTAPPVISIVQSTTNVCPTNTVIFTASGAINYAWSGGVTNGAPFSPLSTSVYTVTGTNGCGSSTGTVGISVTALPVSSVVSPTLICAGGTATLTAGGAVNYSWSPGNMVGTTAVITASAPTIYTVIGTTSVCAGISTIALAVNPVPTISTLAFTTICEGSTYSLTATGGNSYTWQPGNLAGQTIVINPTVSGLYSVTGNNSFSCTATANQAINIVSNPVVVASSNKSQICPGTSATLSASGANTYSWTNSSLTNTTVVSPVSTTIYSVIGTNTTTSPQCSKIATVAITIFTVGMAVTPATAICVGSTITLVATGANTYTWIGGNSGPAYIVSPTSSTQYTVAATVVTLGINCPISKTVSVTVNALPTITAAVNRAQVCKNETFSLTGSGAQTYTWSSFQTVASFTVKAVQTSPYSYTVTGTNVNGCQNTATVSVKVSACTGIDELVKTKGLAIFPNPASTAFSVITDLDADLELLNETGQIIKMVHITGGQTESIDVAELSRGVYFLKGNIGGNLVNEKIVLQ